MSGQYGSVNIVNEFIDLPGWVACDCQQHNPTGMNQHTKTMLVEEHILVLSGTGGLCKRFLCTPSHLAELAVGYLVSSGIIRGLDDITYLHISADGKNAQVQLANGLSGKPASLESLPPATCAPKSEIVFDMVNAFIQESELYEQTHGVHGCLIWCDARILPLQVDIGRHNAMDKAIGNALLSGIDLRKACIFTSGRIPVDVVKKVIHSRIPVLLSKAVATHQAIQVAAEHHLSLCFSATPQFYKTPFQ